ncbi:MAG: PBP1A family penicillin-binding protein [Desulfobacterales bacterium]
MSVRGRPRRRRWLWKGLAAAALLTVAAVGLYGAWLFLRIDGRFSGQRWQLPSKIYSDVTLLYPGLEINRRLFADQLDRLEYRPVSRPPARPGEQRIGAGRIEIYLHELKTPDRVREGFPVEIAVAGDRISRIRHRGTGETLPMLELEPEEIDLFFGPERERRRLISIEEVPDHLIQAVLTAEDNRFFRHHGIDWKGILRAAAANIRHGEIRQGGSTITQQLAKNYFLSPERTIVRKLRELLMAVLIELRYDKRTILEMYFNEIYLGQKGSTSINGIGEASWFYFGKPVEDLQLSESAAIAALIRGPNAYSPYLHPERCEKRRRHLLDQMREDGVIDEAAWREAMEHPVSPVGYEVFSKRAPYFVDYLSRQLVEFYSPEDLASLGLSIYTTLDPQVQQAAETALRKGIERIEKRHPRLVRKGRERLQGALVVLQPRTGAILAMVGGRDYGESQFNRVTQARRQAGSTFKPFVYLAALDRLTPVSILSNTPVTYTVDGRTWEPKNYSPSDRRGFRMREALALSVNRATVHLAMDIGIDKVIETAAGFGFSTPLPAVPSLALGAVDLIPLELARAYGVLAAGGTQAYPLSIRDVQDQEGRTLERRSVTLKQVISPAKAYLMTSLLQSAVTEGTGRALLSKGIDFPVAGKTGTTNNNRDAWFIGYTPDLLILVWVGFDDGTPVLESGATAALPIWADVAAAVPHRISGLDFAEPPGIVRKSVCFEDTENIPPLPCQDFREEIFLEDMVPEDDGFFSKPGAFFDRLLRKFKREKSQN